MQLNRQSNCMWHSRFSVQIRVSALPVQAMLLQSRPIILFCMAKIVQLVRTLISCINNEDSNFSPGLYNYLLRWIQFKGKTAVCGIAFPCSSQGILPKIICNTNGYRLMVDRSSSKRSMSIRLRLAIQTICINRFFISIIANRCAEIGNQVSLRMEQYIFASSSLVTYICCRLSGKS